MASVTTAVYVPAAKLVLIKLVEPLLQRMVYGAVPSLGVAVIVPFVPAKQLKLVDDAVADNKTEPTIVTVPLVVQPLKSVTT